jgi:hypothetical protein
LDHPACTTDHTTTKAATSAAEFCVQDAPDIFQKNLGILAENTDTTTRKLAVINSQAGATAHTDTKTAWGIRKASQLDFLATIGKSDFKGLSCTCQHHARKTEVKFQA